MTPVKHLFRSTVVLSRPSPCSLSEAQRIQDRLLAAGIEAEVVEHDDNGINMWANTTVGGEVTPAERYVIRVRKDQSELAEATV
jgi:hypothetical protein